MSESEVGIQIGASTLPSDLPAAVVEAERLGYGEVWLAEDYFELGGVASVTAALAATEHIRVGLGIVAAPVRHPAVTAMEFATIEGMYPHRFLAGIGHGSPGWVKQMGLTPASPIRMLREVTAAVRDLLDGQELSQEGEYFSFDRVRLLHCPNPRVPIYLGVHGPASLRLSGELADGTLLGWFSSPGYVAWARERIDEGRARGDRQDSHQLAVLCLLSISNDDPAGVRRKLGRWTAPMLKSMAGSTQFKNSPEGRDLIAFITASDEATLAEGPPDELLGDFVAAGDETSCRATVTRLLEAGADRVVMVPNPAGYRSTASMVEQIRLAAALI